MPTKDSRQPAILLIGHGTRIASGVAEFQLLAKQLQRVLPDRTCVAGFLELAKPTLPEVLEQLRQQGFWRITALPALLLAAGHMKRDIPTVLSTYQAHHPELSITFGKELGIDANLLQIAHERIESAEVNFGLHYRRQETVLLVVGRGSSDPEANANLRQITGKLGEMLDFSRTETAYTAVASPLILEALEQASQWGCKQILLLPYLLFDGHLMTQIRATVATYQMTHPDRKSVLAPYLNNHPLLVQTILKRLAQAEAGVSAAGSP
jgi:sirohydrochlorin cobaltochelatase